MKKYLLMLMTGFTILSHAEDMGVVGKVYPITEPDMIEWIKSRANTMMQNGQWQQLQNKAIINTKNQINHPTPISGITDATETKSWSYAPIIELKKDLTDLQGHVIAHKGMYNALRYKPFDVKLLFINGNNPKQVAWAVAQNEDTTIRTKVVLTQGSFIDLDKKYKLWFYYDQDGKYSQKLKISHVPAMVKQDGDKLKVTEINNNEL